MWIRLRAQRGSAELLPPENATGNYVKVVQRIPVKIVLESDHRKSGAAAGKNVEATVVTK